jgi:hypothetical protein
VTLNVCGIRATEKMLLVAGRYLKMEEGPRAVVLSFRQSRQRVDVAGDVMTAQTIPDR